MIMKNEIKKRIDRNYLKNNLRANLLYILSSVALLMVVTPWYSHIVVMGVGMFLFQFVFTVLFQIAVFSQVSCLSDNAKKAPRYVKILSGASTAGICSFHIVDRIAAVVRYREIINAFAARHLSLHIDFCILFGIVIALLSLASGFIVYTLTVLILKTVTGVLRESFCSFSRAERNIYAIVTFVLISFVCGSFFIGKAFWGNDLPLDVLYTSDSSILVRENAYLSLMHSENDLRQPLFAVFAAPFVGMGYAFALPFSFVSPVVTPLCMNIVQVLMLAAGNLMLADMLSSDRRERICIVLFTSVTYTTILFSVMMEQYIVCYFWMMFAVYSAVKNKRASGLSICASGGTLLTGVTLLPLVHDFTDKKDNGLKQIAIEMGKCVSLFIVLLLSFGRIDVMLSSFVQTQNLSRFAGGESFSVRLKQYLSFISSCFAAPETKVVNNYSLQLSESNYASVSILGIILLVVCLVSVILNRKDKLAVIAGLWLCFSFLLIAVIGWGSVENGEILYSLYFCWAFIVLLIRFLDWISEKLGCVWFTMTVGGGMAAVLCLLNYSGIKDLWRFASAYYPL